MRITKSLVLTFSIFAFVGCTEDGSKTYKPNQNRSTVKYTGEPLGIVGEATVSDSGTEAAVSDTDKTRALYSSIASCTEGDISTMIQDVPLSGLMDKSSYTPLIRAAKAGCIPWLKALIDHGVDINETDGLQKTALHWAAIGDKKDVVTELLNKRDDIDPNLQDHEGKTSLSWAVFRNHSPSTNLDTLKLLLDFEKTDVNLPDASKKTPLMEAVMVKPVTMDPEEDVSKYISSTDIVELFLVHPRVDVSLKNVDDLTALDFAKMASNSEVATLLETHQAKASATTEEESSQ